jgi:hypothetical protein
MINYFASPEWFAIRDACIAAANGKCEFCGRTAETAHHVKYPKVMGTEDPDTLIACCWPCHGLLHGKRMTHAADTMRGWQPMLGYDGGDRPPEDVVKLKPWEEERLHLRRGVETPRPDTSPAGRLVGDGRHRRRRRDVLAQPPTDRRQVGR